MFDKNSLRKLLSNSMRIFSLCLLIALQSWPQARAAEDEEAEVVKVENAYVSLGDALVLNLRGKKRNTFLQLSADILVRDSDSEDTIKMHIPAIRHSLIVLLSEQEARDIKSPEKREAIRKIATTQIKTLIAELSGNEDVSDVLFSSILVQ